MVSPSAPSDPELTRLLLEAGAVKFGTFTLASGATSDVYIDIKQVWTRPERLRAIAARFAARVGDAELLAGMELGAVPLVVATALATGLPYVVVRKAAKAHGTGQRYEGTVPPGARTLVLEDVVTTGGSVADTVGVLRGAGAELTGVLAVVDRGEGGREKLAALGVELGALATLAELRRSRA